MSSTNDEIEIYFVSELYKNKENIVRNEAFAISHSISKYNKRYDFVFNYYQNNEKNFFAKLIKTSESNVSSNIIQDLFNIEIKHVDNEDTKYEFVVRVLKWGFYLDNLKNGTSLLEDFRYALIKVYGSPPFTYPGIAELEIFLNGLPFILRGILPVYRFRSIFPDLLADPSEQYRIVYVYAFSLKNADGYQVGSSVPVVFFLPVRNNDDGCILERLQHKFKNAGVNHSIDLTKIDIDYDTLTTFLIDKTDHLVSYSPVDRHMIRGANYLFWGEDYVKRYNQMVEYYKNENFDDGLALLRKLVQDAEEFICNRKGIQLPKKPDVQNLADALRESGIIDTELEKWFDIVTSYSNYASHKTYPTKKDLEREPWLKDRHILTFLIGMNLIKELEEGKYR
ncbi:hypothetical protein [Candidatus Nitrosocosmicus hydrocola]|uniref:hypothetical protein n=1 Tax=Candidatus Nitrosocosmicus hydrocola TaxID=1826872 RepID=UPI0011E5B64A|nr:hypothetical protein [Candidatus Nitrosocosmicus hydrocola]